MLAGGADSLDRRPLISYTACWSVSPLRYATETVEIRDRIVAQRLPVVISSAPQAGATAPAALAGTLVQITAEQLSGFVYVNLRSEEHTSELQSLMRISYAVFCLKKKTTTQQIQKTDYKHDTD